MARHSVAETLKPIGGELTWLAGSYAAAFWGVKGLLGYPGQDVNSLDIQLHNTYFVLSVPVAATPLFAAVAALLAAGRLASGHLRTPYTTAVLVGLAGLWLLIIAVVVWAAGMLRLAHGR